MKLQFDLVKRKRGVLMPSYDISLRQLIGTNIEAGVSSLDIAERLGVSPGLCSYYRKKLKTFRAVITPPITPRGRKHVIHLAAQEAIKEQLAANPTMYLDELQVWLEEEWDLTVHVSIISRCLARMKKTHKKTERVNPERDPDLRAVWLFKIAQAYKASQLIIVDESAANERTKDRRWG